MATKGSKKNGNTSGNSKSPPKFSFVNYTLTKADLEQIEALDLETEFPRNLVDELVMEGYKFSLGYHEQNQTFTASLTDKIVGGAHENQCLTGRGSTPADAWHSLAFRHFVLAQSDWSFFGEREDTPSSRYG